MRSLKALLKWCFQIFFECLNSVPIAKVTSTAALKDCYSLYMHGYHLLDYVPSYNLLKSTCTSPGVGPAAIISGG